MAFDPLPTASVKIVFEEKTHQAAACGDGPVDAAYEAIREAIGLSPKLENYSIRAVTGGKEALGEATVRIAEDGKKFVGRGISTAKWETSVRKKGPYEGKRNGPRLAFGWTFRPAVAVSGPLRRRES